MTLLFPTIELEFTLQRPSEYAKGAINIIARSDHREDYNYITINGSEMGFKALSEISFKVELVTTQLSKLDGAIRTLFGNTLNDWYVSEVKAPVEEQEKPEEIKEETTDEEIKEEIELLEKHIESEETPYGLKELPKQSEQDKYPKVGDTDEDGNICLSSIIGDDKVHLLYVTKVSHSATGRTDMDLPTTAELKLILINTVKIRGVLDPYSKLPMIGHKYWTRDSHKNTNQAMTVSINYDGKLHESWHYKSSQIGRLHVKRVIIEKT